MAGSFMRRRACAAAASSADSTCFSTRCARLALASAYQFVTLKSIQRFALLRCSANRPSDEDANVAGKRLLIRFTIKTIAAQQQSSRIRRRRAERRTTRAPDRAGAMPHRPSPHRPSRRSGGTVHRRRDTDVGCWDGSYMYVPIVKHVDLNYSTSRNPTSFGGGERGAGAALWCWLSERK